jgi:starch-binding outer membrane protein, SusD/RagB family
MNIYILRKIAYVSIIIILFFGCENFLQEEVYTQYDSKTYLQTEKGINSILVSAYSYVHVNNAWRTRMMLANELPGDIMFEWGGGLEALAMPYMTFTWNSEDSQLPGTWNVLYKAIMNANSILDNIDNVTTLSTDKIKQFKGEAIFIRAIAYYFLWELWGPVPIITTNKKLNFEPSKSSEKVIISFIEEELQAAADVLPVTPDLWGKASKGAALSYLGRLYLNTYQWQKAADVCKNVIDLNYYSLFDGDLTMMFAVENEENDEVIFTSPVLNSYSAGGFHHMACSFPPNYPVQSNWINWGCQFCVYSDFVLSYHHDDKRLGWMLLEYTDVEGVYHDCLDPSDISKGVRCFKYVPDPNAIGISHGNDIPMIRYAEVLLNRAEALNELNGPNIESINLINLVRSRAGVPNYDISDFSSKEELRDAILEERGWEFVTEGLRRMDLIRHGKLISRAIERGATNAKDYMTRFPIPQSEINSNSNLEQNPGY